MIGKLTGRIDYVAEDHVLVEVGGVGYVVHCATPTLLSLPPPGGTAALYTELVVREDMMQLVGFRTLAEREWHRLLTSVQGVGTRVALAILGAIGADGVSRALALRDPAPIRAAPGVGPKLAARIVNELADRAPSVMALGAQGRRRAAAAAPTVGAPTVGAETVGAETDGGATNGASPLDGTDAAAARDGGRAGAPSDENDDQAAAAAADALSALVNLGYDPAQAARAVAEAAGAVEAGAGGAGTAALIKAALKSLARTL